MRRQGANLGHGPPGPVLPAREPPEPRRGMECAHQCVHPGHAVDPPGIAPAQHPHGRIAVPGGQRGHRREDGRRGQAQAVGQALHGWPYSSRRRSHMPLVAPFRRAVQPGVHAPDRVRAARVRGIAVVDHAVLQHEGAHALAFAQVGGRVGAGRRRPGHEFRRRRRGGRQFHGGIVAPEVVFRPLALLGLGERGIEVVVEIAAGRRGPREGPAHAPLVDLKLVQRRARHRPQHHVVMRQMRDDAVETVGDRRAGRAARLVVRPEHEVIDQQLRTALEQVGQRGAAGVGLQAVGLVQPYPGWRLALPRHFVTLPRQLLFRVQQFQPGGQPLLACSDLVRLHCSLLVSVLAPRLALAGCREILRPIGRAAGVTNLARIQPTRIPALRQMRLAYAPPRATPSHCIGVLILIRCPSGVPRVGHAIGFRSCPGRPTIP